MLSQPGSLYNNIKKIREIFFLQEIFLNKYFATNTILKKQNIKL